MADLDAVNLGLDETEADITEGMHELEDTFDTRSEASGNSSASKTNQKHTVQPEHREYREHVHTQYTTNMRITESESDPFWMFLVVSPRRTVFEWFSIGAYPRAARQNCIHFFSSSSYIYNATPYGFSSRLSLCRILSIC